MAVIHIVLFKFQQGTSKQILDTFVTELRKLKHLSCVYEQNLVVGGPSITNPIARSKGYDFCLVSYHRDRASLEEYQASAEHHHVTSKYMWPFNDGLIRFDFETEANALDPLTALLFAKKESTEMSHLSLSRMKSGEVSPTSSLPTQ